jgi:hypothetical protein
MLESHYFSDSLRLQSLGGKAKGVGNVENKVYKQTVRFHKRI